MASRDLTADFVKRRTAAKIRRRDSHHINAVSQGQEGIKPFGGLDTNDSISMEEGVKLSPIRSSVLPPKWVTEVDSIHNIICEINNLIEILESMHASRIGTVFGKDLDDMEAKIDKFTGDITGKFRQAERLLQSVGIATRKTGGEESIVGMNVQRSLAKKLQELSVDFRQSQRKYLLDVQAQKNGALAETESQFGIDLNEREKQYGFNETQIAIVDDLHDSVQSRDKEISKIAKSIEELGAIFKELAVLVIDQGTILDRIDYNMESVVEHTKEGIQQLEKAESHQKSARSMKCIICLAITIALLLVILVLKHRGKRGIF